MPQLSPITVQDRAATPNDVIYTPSTKDNGVAVFTSSDGIPIGDKKATVSIRSSQNRTKVKLVLTDPVLVNETINGVSRSKVDRTAYANLEFSFSDDSTPQERKDLVGKMASALSSDQTFLMGVCQDLEGIWG